MSRRFRPISERYTGFEVEADILSSVGPKARYDGTYKPYIESLKLVAANQPEGWDPTDPPVEPSPIPSELHYLVSEDLGEEFDDYTLGMYTASKSTLDVKHGVDAFFTLSKDKDVVWVTLDITTNPKKDSYKADLILHIPNDFTDTEITSAKDREKTEKNWAEEIAVKLKDRMEAKTFKRSRTVSV